MKVCIDITFWVVCFVVLFSVYYIFKWLTKAKLKSFAKKVVVITGGASGIGKCLVEEFLKEGSIVVMLDINKLSLENAKKEFDEIYGEGKVHAFVCDVTDKESLFDVAWKIKDEIGPASVLFNNAGITPRFPTKSHCILNLPDEEIEKVMKVNVLSHFWTMKAFLPQIVEAKKGGHIACTSSIAALCGQKFVPCYSASKAACFNLMESVGDYERTKRRGIDYTIICPKEVDTPMFRKMLEEYKKQGGRMKKIDTFKPEYVAKMAIRGMKERKNLVVLPKKYGIFIWLKRILGKPPVF